MTPGGARLDLLDGLRVLEVGDGVAGAAATALLRSFGAEVTAVIDPSSPHRRGRPAVGSTSLLAVVLDRGKRTIAAGDVGLEGLAALARDVDLVVFDRVGGVPAPLAPLASADEHAAFVAATDTGAWVSISAFGLTGPRRDDVATELAIAAASGMLASVRSPATGRPLKLAGCQSLLVTAQAAALAACHALDLARDGAPVHLDLAAVEATIAMGPTLEIGAVLLNAGGPGGAKRYGAPASFYPCVDGRVRISAMEDHQWAGVVAAMGAPAWTERCGSVEARIELRDEIDERIAVWTATMRKVDAETLLQSHGVPATAMYSPRETLESPQLRHRGSFADLPLPDGRIAAIVDPRGRAIRPDDAGARRRRWLRGLRVLEMSHVLAAPMAGSLLGALGADVAKLEDSSRLDMYRRRGPYIDGHAGEEWSSYFALVNHSKRSASFDLEGEPDRLAGLVADADVVLENLGGRRATRLGLAAAEVVRRHPDTLAVSSSGFGQDGPHASYRAYAYNLQAACDLGYLTRDVDGAAAEIDLPWADYVSGFALATTIAAWAVGPQGNVGVGIDFAMADLIVSHFNEFVAAASLDPGSDAGVDRANDVAPYAPNGVYATEDGWIAISVGDDSSLVALGDVLGEERLHAHEGARFERRAELDELVGRATAAAKAAVLAADLRAAGVVAEEVVGPRSLPEVAQLVDRGFFTEVEHPEWNRRRLIGVPWRRYGHDPIALGAPPLLGDGGEMSSWTTDTEGGG